jgi:DNA-binding transcriptional ArsR family regulator
VVPEDRCELLCLDLPKAEAVRAAVPRATVAASAAARAKPTPLSLAAALGKTEERCVCDLPWISGRTDALVSHHLRLLRAAGLASSRRDGNIVLYSLTSAGRRLLDGLLDEVAA